MRRILWADDDSDEQLRGLSLLLKTRGVMITDRVREFVKARELVNDTTRGTPPFSALLVDMILPYGPQKPSLQSYLGLKLAKEALSAGVPAVAFLSVVPQIEVSDQYGALHREFPAARVAYFDKLTLLEQRTMAGLVEILSTEIKK